MMTPTHTPARVLHREWLDLLAVLHLRVSFTTRDRLTDAQRSELHRRIEAHIRAEGGQ